MARITQTGGGLYTPTTYMMCTGCGEEFRFDWAGWKGDFPGNASDYEQFLNWATWSAKQHECFDAGGRVGYLVEPEPDDDFSRWLREDSEFHGSIDFSQVEHHEDPWGEAAMRARREAAKTLPFDVMYMAEDNTMRRLVDDLGGYWPGEFDMGDDDLEEPCFEHEECDMEPCMYTYDGDEDDEEGPFDFIYDLGDPMPIDVTVTGRLREQMRDPYFVLELTPPAPVTFDIFYIEEFEIDEGGPTGAVIKFDYGELEQRIIDQMMLDAGIYSLDAHGCLRDEKGRCLACLRPGPHLPFYYERPD